MKKRGEENALDNYTSTSIHRYTFVTESEEDLITLKTSQHLQNPNILQHVKFKNLRLVTFLFFSLCCFLKRDTRNMTQPIARGGLHRDQSPHV